MNALATAAKPEPDVVDVVCVAIRAIHRTISDVASRASAMLCAPVATGGNPAIVHASGITLLSPRYGLELRIAAGGDVRDLAHQMLGEGSDRNALDLLAELANLAMGGLKLELGDLDPDFASGTPDKLSQQAFRDSGFSYTEEIAIDCGAVVRFGLRRKRASSVLPRELREGMVLAGDLRNAQGVLLAPTGTRLSMHMLDRLVNALAPTSRIEVAVA